MPAQTPEFTLKLIEWQHKHGRHDLPWQQSRDPYAVWVSEIMLQQTQVVTVIPYYQRFMVRFPDVQALAAAEVDEVLALWSGLGYYARGRNLHQAARRIVCDHGGVFPQSQAELMALPGIGRSTAAAICAFCFGQSTAICDGNVRRVLCRHFGIEGYAGDKAVAERLWALAESLMPPTGAATYTQALMDMGATLCTRRRPDCQRCPVVMSCIASCEERTASLPTPRPPKSLPEREGKVLLLTANDYVLLEKRPQQGLWGGMWSLPEIPTDLSPSGYATVLCGYVPEGKNAELLPIIRHTFSHFHYLIEPWCLDISPRLPGVAEESRLIWVRYEDIERSPLPAPMRTLLQRFLPGRASDVA